MLQQRLRKSRIPEFFVKWIYSFCSNRRASIAFDDFCSEVVDITQPSLPQGSPLSLVLYILFNTDLLIGVINATEGDIGFVDDYTAWVVGNSAEENTAKLQACIIPRVIEWERKSGATFEAEKTQFIHFTRNRTKAQRPFTPLQMNSKNIVPKLTVKVLGVYLDEHLRMSEHIQKAAQKAKVQAMALSTVRGLRPASMRQLYTSTVASKLDYAAPVWFQSEKQGSHSHKTFEAIQKIGSRTILGAYKTAAGPILEAEAGLLPTTLRLERRVMQYIINLHTLPKEHPWWPLSKWFRKKITRFKSPLVQHLHRFQDTIGNTDDQPIETIQAFAQHPSADRKSLRFVTYEDRQVATAEAKRVAPAMYTDGSNRNGNIGIGVVWRSRELPALRVQGLIQHCDRGADWIRT